MSSEFPSPTVSTDWLGKHIGEKDIKVVDGSWRMPGKGDARDDYAERHIPGAVFFPIDEIANRETLLPHMLPPPAAFARAVGAMGIANGDPVVVYDDQGLFSAARVWWTFKAMGHEHVSVLDGGLPKWVAEGRPVTDERPRPRAAAYRASLQANRVVNAGAVREALRDGAGLVLDARPAGRFVGRDAEPRPGLRKGHMPGASSVPAASLVAADGTLKPQAELEAILLGAGANGREVITTCGSGVMAAIISLALEAIGHPRHALYDGSWAEWGDERNDPALFPVEAGAS